MSTYEFSYNHTNFYLIKGDNGLLAFDAGWPDTYSNYKDGVKSLGLKIEDIKWVIVSHFHMDHAGLLGQFQSHGVACAVFKNQLYGITELEDFLKRKNYNYYPIDQEKLTVLETEQSRTWLKNIGIGGAVIKINGHGEQSVALVLDSGETFIGDMPPYIPTSGSALESDELTLQSWQEIKRLGGVNIKPAHATQFKLN